jgi:tetratricopeptide (TPR) repeat protein
MLADLERICLDQTGVREGHFDRSRADLEYAGAFRGYGIDVEAVGLAEAAALVRDSAIRKRLAAGLADWAASLQPRAKEEKRPKAERLVAIARQADPDPWRNQLRQLLVCEDLSELEQLANSAPVEAVQTAELGRLGVLMELVPERRVQALEPILKLLRRAQHRFPGDFWINHSLGLLLQKVHPSQMEEAISFYRAAVVLRPQSPGARVNLGEALRLKGDLDGAIAEHREAIRLKNDFLLAHNNLGSALQDKGDVDGAIAEYREAIRIYNDLATPHYNLANALHSKKDFDGAIAEYREAIRIRKGDARIHYNLGITLKDKGDLDDAVIEYREAIRIKKEFAQAHCNLSDVLRLKGQFSEALSYLRRGHELGSKNPRWPYPSADWIKDCERLVELDAKLLRVLKGEVQPADAGERLALAEHCQLPCKSLYATAVRFYAAAFAEQPTLADDLQGHHRYNAACAAALAGCGQGQDTGKLDDKERTHLRKQALDWLNADLEAWRRLLEKGPAQNRPAIAQQLAHWLEDTDFAGVRGGQALARLPAAERGEWQKLWQEVEALRQRAARPPDKAATNRP